VHYWMINAEDNVRVGKGILYFVTSEWNLDGQIVLRDPITCHFDTKRQHCCTSADEQHLEDIFIWLNPFVVKSSASVERHNDYGNPRVLVASVCDENDLLTHLMYALGGGVWLTSQIQSIIGQRDHETSNYVRSDWLAAWSAN
jgi:hypothetical protein